MKMAVHVFSQNTSLRSPSASKPMWAQLKRDRVFYSFSKEPEKDLLLGDQMD